MTLALQRNRGMIITAVVVLAILALMAGQYEPRVSAGIFMSGLTLGALYFLVTSGLSLIFGLMDVLNFAHGLFFMLGAYTGYTFYANPRLVINTVPFFFAILGATAIASWGTSFLAGRPLPRRSEQVLSYALLAIGALLAIYAVWGFDLLKLAANAATAAGGAVPTAEAQETAGGYTGRLIMLLVSGLLLGIGLARRQVLERRATRAPGAASWVMPALGLLAIIAAFAIVPGRESAETWLLGLNSNLRFVLALLVGALGGAALGAFVETSMIRPLYARPIYQVLLTLGLVFVGNEMIKAIWGPAGSYMDVPEFFNKRGEGCRPPPDFFSWFGTNCGSVQIFDRPFPSYRLFIIALGIVVFVAIALLLKRTRIGMIIRAGVQDRDMVQALGINVRRVFTLVFALGTGLAALGGVAAAPFIGVNLGMGQEFMLLAFIAVVIGGMGSYSGAMIGALLVGLARAFGDQLVLTGVQLPLMDEAMKFSPSIARASTVLLMAIVLMIRPAGLFGRKEQ